MQTGSQNPAYRVVVVIIMITVACFSGREHNKKKKNNNKERKLTQAGDGVARAKSDNRELQTGRDRPGKLSVGSVVYAKSFVTRDPSPLGTRLGETDRVLTTYAMTRVSHLSPILVR